jgi:hypothetical protein
VVQLGAGPLRLTEQQTTSGKLVPQRRRFDLDHVVVALFATTVSLAMAMAFASSFPPCHG